MAPSDSADSDTATLLDRIERRSGEPRQGPLRSLVDRAVAYETATGEQELPADTVERVRPALSDPDPVVRSRALSVCTTLVVVQGADAGDGFVGRVLELAADEDPRVRRTALRPRFWTVASRALGTGRDGLPASPVWERAGLDILRRRAAETFVDRLDDDCEVVRNRAARALAPRSNNLAHDAELFLAHPRPERALETILEGLTDPTEGATGGFLKALPVRRFCLRVTTAIAEHEADLLASRVDRDFEAVAERLHETTRLALNGDDYPSVHGVAVLLAAVAEVEESVARTALERADVSLDWTAELNEERVERSLRALDGA